MNEELITSHMNFAENLAKSKKKSVSKTIYYEELQSAAYRGLVDAANKYKDDKIPFEAYARYRITGEMNNYVKELTWGKDVKVSSIEEDIEEIKDHCEDILNSLSSKGKEILSLYYVNRLTMKEIGDRMNLSESMVSKLIKKYRDQLHE